MRIEEFIALSDDEKKYLVTLDLSDNKFIELSDANLQKFCDSLIQCKKLENIILSNDIDKRKPREVYLIFSAFSQCYTHKKFKINLELESLSTTLFDAISCQDLHLVKFLVEQGANVNKVIWIDGSESCPLSCAVLKDNLEMVTYLVEKGAEINKVLQSRNLVPHPYGPMADDYFGAPRYYRYVSKTPLTRGVENNCFKAVAFLLTHGAGLSNDIMNIALLKKLNEKLQIGVKELNQVQILYLYRNKWITKLEELNQLSHEDRLNLVYNVVPNANLQPEVAKIIRSTALEQKARRIAKEYFSVLKQAKEQLTSPNEKEKLYDNLVIPDNADENVKEKHRVFCIGFQIYTGCGWNITQKSHKEETVKLQPNPFERGLPLHVQEKICVMASGF